MRKVSTNEQDYEQLTLFQEGSRASLFPSPGSEEARQMTAISGRKCYELYGNLSQLPSLAKMCLESSIWHSTRCFLTWKKQDTPSKRLLFRLAASTPRTREKGSLLWPTPSTGAALYGGTGNFKTLIALRDAGIITEEERRQLSQGNGGKTNPEFLEWLMGYERKFSEDLIPTPIASDYRGGCLTSCWKPQSCSQIVHVERERERGQARVRRDAAEPNRSVAVWQNWPDESGIPRVLNGVPHRVERIRCLGNAVVPQQFYPFFVAIMNEMRKEAK